MKYLDLKQDYPVSLQDFFEQCFLSQEFEEEFLTKGIESHNEKNCQILHKATVTDWIFDPNQEIPDLSLFPKHGQMKGIDTRMKFYKIRETDDGKTSKFAPVTENQKFFIFDKRKKAYYSNKDGLKQFYSNSRTKKKSNGTTFYVYSLVLPQSSLSKEPIFKIEAIWHINSNCLTSIGTSNNSNCKTNVELRIQVCCTKNAGIWGVNSMIESFLMKQASSTYKNWIKFSQEKILKFVKNRKANEIIASQEQKTLKTIIIGGSIDSNIKKDKTSIDKNIIDMNSDSINIKTKNILSKSTVSDNNSGSIHIGTANMQNIVSRNQTNTNVNKEKNSNDISIDLSHSISHSSPSGHDVLIGGTLINDSFDATMTICNDKDEQMEGLLRNQRNIKGKEKEMQLERRRQLSGEYSRGLKKPKPSLSMRIARICARILPQRQMTTITQNRTNNNSDIRILVDSKCSFVEKTLWCVIISCLFLILLLSFHKYQLIN